MFLNCCCHRDAVDAKANLIDSHADQPVVSTDDDVIAQLRLAIEATVSSEEEAAELRCWFPSELVAQMHLARFLRTAREDPSMRGDVFGAALKLSMEAFRIRLENRVRCIFDKDYFPEGFASLMDQCIGFECGGTDHAGCPFTVMHLGKINTTLLAHAQAMSKDKPGLCYTVLWFIRMMEYITLNFLAARSRSSGKLMYCVHPILIGQALDLRPCFTFALRRWVGGVIKVGCDLYPLSFAELTVLHTAWIGSKAFSLAKPLLHPQTIAKIHLLSHQESEDWVCQMDTFSVPLSIGGAASDCSRTYQTSYPDRVALPLSSLSHEAARGKSSSRALAERSMITLPTPFKKQSAQTSERHSRVVDIMYLLLSVVICGLLVMLQWCEVSAVALGFVTLELITRQPVDFAQNEDALPAEKSRSLMPSRWGPLFRAV